MKSALRSVAAALCTLAFSTQAQEVRPVSLEDCLQLALQKNLDLRIERYNPELATIALHRSYIAYDPTLSLSGAENFRRTEAAKVTDPNKVNPPNNEAWSEVYRGGLQGEIPTGLTYTLTGGMTRSDFTPNLGFDYNSDTTLSLTQPLLKNAWINGTRLNIALAKNDVKGSRLNLLNAIMATATKVATAYYDLIAAGDNVKVQQSALQLAEKSLAENKKRVEVGAMAPLEEKQAASQVMARRADLLTAEAQYGDAHDALRKLMTDDVAGTHEVRLQPTAQLTAVRETFSTQDSWHKGLTLRPDIQSSKLGLENQKLQLKYAKNQMFPELDLVGTYGLTGRGGAAGDVFDDLSARRNPNYSVGMQLNIPLTNRKARDDRRKAILDNEKLLLGHKKLEQSIMFEIDQGIRAAKTALERIGATKSAREYAEAALDAEQRKLENGKSTSFVVLQLQRDLITAQSTEIQALADYNKSLVTLSLSEGTVLERLRVNVNTR